MPPQYRHAKAILLSLGATRMKRTGRGSRRRIMPAHISHDRRLLGFDPMEWLMLVVAVLLLGVVALAV